MKKSLAILFMLCLIAPLSAAEEKVLVGGTLYELDGKPVEENLD